jgi:hypothetical protein
LPEHITPQTNCGADRSFAQHYSYVVLFIRDRSAVPRFQDLVPGLQLGPNGDAKEVRELDGSETAESFRNVSRSRCRSVRGLPAELEVSRQQGTPDNSLNEPFKVIRALPCNQFSEVFRCRHAGCRSNLNASTKGRRTCEPNELLELFEPLEPFEPTTAVAAEATAVDRRRDNE